MSPKHVCVQVTLNRINFGQPNWSRNRKGNFSADFYLRLVYTSIYINMVLITQLKPHCYLASPAIFKGILQCWKLCQHVTDVRKDSVKSTHVFAFNKFPFCIFERPFVTRWISYNINVKLNYNNKFACKLCNMLHYKDM